MGDFRHNVYPAGTVAVIFASRRTGIDAEGYGQAAAAMEAAARAFPGFVGIHSARDAEGFGITVSYWASDADARAWKADAEHSLIRDRGRAEWYRDYELIVAEVTRSYAWSAVDPQA
jgi:heme-degrading monooxygenase HmoA